jgi:O-antigen/teichoic acid export membrane protein
MIFLFTLPILLPLSLNIPFIIHWGLAGEAITTGITGVVMTFLDMFWHRKMPLLTGNDKK